MRDFLPLISEKLGGQMFPCMNSELNLNKYFIFCIFPFFRPSSVYVCVSKNQLESQNFKNKNCFEGEKLHLEQPTDPFV